MLLGELRCLENTGVTEELTCSDQTRYAGRMKEAIGIRSNVLYLLLRESPAHQNIVRIAEPAVFLGVQIQSRGRLPPTRSFGSIAQGKLLQSDRIQVSSRCANAAREPHELGNRIAVKHGSNRDRARCNWKPK
jgi:hypothetical protein